MGQNSGLDSTGVPINTLACSNRISSSEKMSSNQNFAVVKAETIKLLKELNMKTHIDPHHLLTLCTELRDKYSKDQLSEILDQFRDTLHTNVTDSASPFQFSQFWDDIIKCSLFSIGVFDFVPVDTLLGLVIEALSLPKSVELFSDFPRNPAPSASSYYVHQRMKDDPVKQEADIEKAYFAMPGIEKINVVKGWLVELENFVEGLDSFLNVHPDMSTQHDYYVQSLLFKSRKGVELVREKVKTMELDHTQKRYTTTYQLFYKAAAIQSQFDQLSDHEKDEEIQDMYSRMDPLLRQIFIDALVDKNQL